MTTLERLIASWRASPDGRLFAEGATASELEVFEARTGWKLPAEWRELYAFTNGAVLGTWRELYPLFGSPSLLDGHQYWRRRNWPVPDELWLAGWGEVALPGIRSYFWVPIIGPIIGGLAGAFIYDIFIHQVLKARSQSGESGEFGESRESGESGEFGESRESGESKDPIVRGDVPEEVRSEEADPISL